MSKSTTDRIKMNRRRALLLPAAAGLGAAFASQADAADGTKTANAGSCSTPQSAIAKTKYGKVRGYVSDGVTLLPKSGAKVNWPVGLRASAVRLAAALAKGYPYQ